MFLNLIGNARARGFLAGAGFASLALAGCVPAAPQPTPAPAPTPSPLSTAAPLPTPRPSPAPTSTPEPIATEVPTPTYENWMDAPQTPGDWNYRPGTNGGTVLFGESGGEVRLAVHCNRMARTVSIVRTGHAVAALPMQVRTETVDRFIDASPAGAEPPTIAARLPASDSLLDAIAFSKGRFAVEVAGLQTLYLPAWPEITRVIEDCR